MAPKHSKRKGNMAKNLKRITEQQKVVQRLISELNKKK
jgi:hypothetical protein